MLEILDDDCYCMYVRMYVYLYMHGFFCTVNFR